MTDISIGGVRPKNITIGGVEVQRVTIAGTDVWRRGYDFFDDFSSYPNGVLSTPNYNVTTSNNASVVVNSGALDISGNVSASVSPIVQHATQTYTDLCKVSAKIALRAPSAAISTIFLHGSPTSNYWVALVVTTDTASRGIFTNVNGSQTRRTNITAPGQNAVVSLEASHNGTNYVYTVRNESTGAVLGTWTDTGNVMQHGAGYRYGGMMVGANDSFFGDEYSNGWDDFRLQDVV